MSYLFLEPAEMNGSKMPGSGVTGSGGKDPVANGHAENESNPFSEYMWMENEEEYNRQVCTHTIPITALSSPHHKNTNWKYKTLTDQLLRCVLVFCTVKFIVLFYDHFWISLCGS